MSYAEQMKVILFLFCLWLFFAVIYTINRKKVLTTLLSGYIKPSPIQLPHVERKIINTPQSEINIKILKNLSSVGNSNITFKTIDSLKTKPYVPKLSSSIDKSTLSLFNKSSQSSQSIKSSVSSKGKSMVGDYKNKMFGSMDSNNKYDNMSKEEREKQLKKDQQMRNLKRIPALIKKLSSGPAGLIILVIIVILDNVLKLDVNDFDKCPPGEFDLMSLPGYVRTIIGLVPNLGDLFDLIGNKLCFKPGCKPGYNKQDGLCYKDCRPGYQAVGPVCWKRCGADIDVGALCRNRCRPGYKEVAGVCWGGCPSGYRDDGAFCTRDLKCNTKWDKCKDRRKIAGRRTCFGGLVTRCTPPDSKTKASYVPHTYPKQSYGRGAGQIPLNISMKPRKK